MNKTTKIFALVCGCLVVVGLAMAATAWQMGIKPYNIGFNSQGVVVTDDNTPISGKEELSTFTELNCDIDQAQVTLIPSDHYALEYQVFSQDDVPTFSLQGNTLTLTQKSNDVLHANLNLNFANTWNTPYINLYYDKNHPLSKADVHLSLGDLIMENVDAQDITLKVDLGNIRYSGQAKTLDFTLSTGDLTCQAVAEKMKLDVSLGSADLKTSSIQSLQGSVDTGDFTCHGTLLNVTFTQNLGNFTCSDATLSNVTYTGDCGNCTIDGTLTGANSFTCSLGDVRITSDIPREQYNLNISCNLGNATINKAQSSGQSNTSAIHTITAHADTGNVTINLP